MGSARCAEVRWSSPSWEHVGNTQSRPTPTGQFASSSIRRRPAESGKVGVSRPESNISRDGARCQVRPARARRVCQACRLRSEVEVLSWGPDRGNPTLMRQGRGPELTGWSACAVVWRGWSSVRAGLKEAIGAWWSRTRVKRRKASFGGVSWLVAAKPDSCWCRGRIGDEITAKSQRLTLGDLLVSGVR